MPNHPSPRLRVVIQRYTDRPTVMAVVLTNDLLAMQLPQSRIVVGTSRNQVRTVGTERAVPNPALVPRKRGLERERYLFFAVLAGRWRRDVNDLPDLGRVVGTARRQLLDVW
jgi:hypothetical protein